MNYLDRVLRYTKAFVYKNSTNLTHKLGGCAVAALAGCASAPPPAVPVTVKVPVPVPCRVAMPAPPPFTVADLPLGANVYEQFQALRAEREQRIGYEVELVAAVKACSE